MEEPAPGNLKSPAAPAKSPVSAGDYWRTFFARCLALVYAVWIAIDLTHGEVPIIFGRHSYRPLTLAQDGPALFFGLRALELGIAIGLFFYSPQQGWAFTWRLPEPDPVQERGGDDGDFEGYKQPPKKLGPLRLEPFHLSEILDPALGRSLLMVVWVFGLMLSLMGAVQLFYGVFYIGSGDSLTIVDYADDHDLYRYCRSIR